jgi:hypothetical protein
VGNALCRTEAASLDSKISTPKMSAGLSDQAVLLWRKLHNADASTEDFIRLPHGASGTAAPHWLVQLENLGLSATTLNIEIVSDVVLGITRSAHPMPDFDLAPYGGIEQGVSRQHAMLRPSERFLYLIDLGSTNGTCINKLQINYRIAVPLEDGDIVSLGTFSFTLKILATPADFNKARSIGDSHTWPFS